MKKTIHYIGVDVHKDSISGGRRHSRSGPRSRRLILPPAWLCACSMVVVCAWPNPWNPKHTRTFHHRGTADTEQPSRNQGGVRPSSGAATPETLSASHLSAAVRTSCDAAPEDGRTPGLSEKILAAW